MKILQVTLVVANFSEPKDPMASYTLASALVVFIVSVLFFVADA